MTSKIFFDSIEVGEFLSDADGNFMGITWITEIADETKYKVQDIVERNYLSAANKIPTSSINITSAQIS